MVDGSLARALDQVTDTGKLLDPFADVIARLTYFVCFVATGIMPAWTFILIMYRELGVTFLRMIMYKEGFALAAKRGGKLKAVSYAFSGGFGVFIHTCRILVIFSAQRLETMYFAGKIFFAIAAVLSILSFADYWFVFLKHKKKINFDQK
jgi:CDP-diacylglycerol--glycerol-3-phosphate 3-phosphatidyltransferase